MIPDKFTPEEEFDSENAYLQNVLREVPMTAIQREKIEKCIDEMERIFRELLEKINGI